VGKVLIVLALLFLAACSGTALTTPDERHSLDRISDEPIVFTSNLFTQYVVPFGEVESPNPSLAGFTLAAENEFLQLYVAPYSLAIKVVNRATGYIFSSTLDTMEDHRLNNIWRNRVNSALSIDYSVGGVGLWESLTINDSYVDFRLIENGFAGHVTFGDSGIGVLLLVTLEGRDLLVQVPQESITEPEGVQIVALHAYPFFGATKEGDVPGYMFIPDGSGALIRYGDIRNAMVSPWSSQVYGLNLGLGQSTISNVNPPFNTTMPVFGKVHGNNAFLVIIESGDNYAEIIAHTAGLITEFNWIHALFTYRYTFTQPTTRDETRAPSVHRLQQEPNIFDIGLRFRFLENEDASYVGMAIAYQEFLVSRGWLTPMIEPAPQMRLEFFGGEIAPGTIFNQYLVMTHVTDIPGFISRLQTQGMYNMLAVYRSFARGGSVSFPNRFPIDRRLGSAADVRNTAAELTQNGVSMFFHSDYSRAYVSGGLFGRSDLALGINGRLFLDWVHWRDFFYLTPQAALEQARRDVETFERFGIQNLALQTTASVLHSTFNDNATNTRADVRDMLDELVDVLNPAQLALYQPNVYAWQLTDLYFDVPMSSSRHLFVTDTVPFLQIVLRGHVAYYAPFANFSANWNRDLLRLVEFGAYPSFLLTGEPAHLLYRTAAYYIYSSQFDIWEDLVVLFYNRVAGALYPVRNQPIVGREMLATGVVKVTYANGVEIFVNYTNQPFNYNGLTIPAEDFLVRGAN